MLALSGYVIHYALIRGFLHLRFKLNEVFAHLNENTAYKYLIALVHVKHMLVLSELCDGLQLGLNIGSRELTCFLELERLFNLAI